MHKVHLNFQHLFSNVEISRLVESGKHKYIKWLIISASLMMGTLFLLYSHFNGFFLLAAKGLLAEQQWTLVIKGKSPMAFR